LQKLTESVQGSNCYFSLAVSRVSDVTGAPRPNLGVSAEGFSASENVPVVFIAAPTLSLKYYQLQTAVGAIKPRQNV